MKKEVAAIAMPETFGHDAKDANVDALKHEIEALKDTIINQEKKVIIETALAEGKLTKALVPWAETQTIENLKKYLEVASPIAALKADFQSKEALKEEGLSAHEKAICDATGTAYETFFHQRQRQSS